MAKRPWPILVGSAAIVVAAVVVASNLQPAARAGGRAVAAVPGTCRQSPARTANPDPGATWRLADRLDAGGSMVGRTLAVGHGGSVELALDLPVEGSARGPVDGLVVVSADDGWRSEIRLVSATEACSWLVASLDDVVRSAVYDAANKVVVAHLVDRVTRADRGIWRVSAFAANDEVPAQIAPPAGAAAAALGTIWTTDLRVDATARRLAIQQCSQAGCVTRLVDLRGRRGIQIVGRRPALQGGLIGLAPRSIVTWDWCPGLPCPILAWDLATGDPSLLTEGAIAAALTGDGRHLVLVKSAPGGTTLRIDLVSRAEHRIEPFEAGALPLADGPGALVGLEVEADEIAIGAFDGDPRPFRPAAAEALK